MLNIEQKEAFEIIKNGKNVFITGGAGVGKSFLIKFIQKWGINKNINIEITALTGIAALLIGGKTLHSWAGIGLGKEDKITLYMKILGNKNVVKRWLDTKILVIDEISMLSVSLFEKLNYIGQKIRHSYKPFGGIQLVFVGDFAQLPPVENDNINYLFNNKEWINSIDRTLYLKINSRQTDPEFSNMLNEIRIGIVTDKTFVKLQSKIGIKLEGEIKPTKIYSTRSSVDDLNLKKLNKLIIKGNPLKSYICTDVIKGKCHNTEYITTYVNTNSNFRKELQICVGAQVMLIYNLDVKAGLVNGSRGIVKSFIEGYPSVLFSNGIQIVVTPIESEYKIQDNIRLIRTQIPLILAWASTVHKSQGCTLDCVSIDLGSSIFAYGQAYTALSRVKSFDSLTLEALDISKIIANPAVTEFYNILSSYNDQPKI